jgi:hypothetical protein
VPAEECQVTFGPACDWCGARSYDGAAENPRCPWCHKVKNRGSRAALVEELRHVEAENKRLREQLEGADEDIKNEQEAARLLDDCGRDHVDSCGQCRSCLFNIIDGLETSLEEMKCE